MGAGYWEWVSLELEVGDGEDQMGSWVNSRLDVIDNLMKTRKRVLCMGRMPDVWCAEKCGRAAVPALVRGGEAEAGGLR